MQHSDAVGLVLARPARLLGVEPFFAEFMGGVEEGLAHEGRSLLFHVVPDAVGELAAYRRWATGSMVEAVIVVNLHADDSRLGVLLDLGIPAVVIGGPRSGLPMSNVWVDDDRAMQDAIDYLVLLGHENIARVTGPVGLHHTHERDTGFALACARHGVRATTLEGDYSEESGRHCTRILLGRPDPVTAIVYDNDLMALAGLGVAAELGQAVPGDVSMLAWDDSTLCRLSNPQLSAMTLDVHALGNQASDAVLNTLAGGPVKTYLVPQQRLSARASTAAASTRSAQQATPPDE